MTTPITEIPNAALAWITGNDTGMSSKAIWAHMMGQSPEDRFGVYHPHDPSDFGRCYRLLALVPDWRSRLGEMARYSGEWARLVERWADIEAVYREEVVMRPHATMAHRTYDLMKSILRPTVAE